MSRQPSGSAQRMSSVIRPSDAGSLAGKLQDGRNLKSQDVRRQHVDILDRFFRANSPGIQLSVKAFQEPTAKDFGVMWEEISRCLCMRKPKEQKLEDNVAEMLKLLKYPFQLSKSSLGAPGASNTWPNIRAALVWMIDIVHSYQSRALRRQKTSDNVRCSTDDAQKVSTRNYLKATYIAFMDMDDIEQENLEAKRQMEYTKQSQVNEELNETLKTQEPAIQKKIMECSNRPSQKEEMDHKIKEAAKDEQMLEDKERQSQEVVAKLKKKNDQKEVDIKTLQNNIKRAEQEIVDAKASISTQKYNKLEMDELMSRKKRSEQNLEVLRLQTDSMRKENSDSEGKITDLRYLINEKMHKYNTLATVLKLIPSSTKRAQGINFTLNTDVSTSNTELQLPENVKAQIVPGIGKLTKQYKSKAQQLAQESEIMNRQLGKKRKLLSDLQSEVQTMKEELDTKLDEINTNQAAHEREQANTQAEINTIEKEISAVQEKTGVDLEDALLALDEAEKNKQQAEERCQKEVQDFKSQIMESLKRQDVIFHKAKIAVEQHTAECHAVKAAVDTFKDCLSKRDKQKQKRKSH